MARALGTSLLALTAAVSPAFADDAPNARWAGPYVGIHAGYAHGSTDFTTSCPFGVCDDRGSFDTSGAVFGALAGYNFPIHDRFIIGVETDFSFSSIDGDAFFGGKNPSSDVDALATFRARLGWLPCPDVMLYATAGLAIADISHSIVADRVNGETYKWSDIEVGWTAGAGIEYLFGNTFTLRVEYLYYDFGSSTHTAQFFGDIGTVRFEDQFHTVRAALTYKFD